LSGYRALARARLARKALAADDVKAAMTVALDRLDTSTAGGLEDLYDKLAARQDALLADLASGALTATRETVARGNRSGKRAT